MRAPLILGLVCCGMLAAASTALSQTSGVLLAWDNCSGGGGVPDRTFACDANTGFNYLYVSFVAPQGISMFVAMQADLDFSFGSTTTPPWWQVRNQTGQQNQCRNGALSAAANSIGTGCVDFYQGNASGGVSSYQIAYGGQPNRAHARLFFGVPSANGGPLVAGVEYYACRALINNVKTVSTCAGCQTTACISGTSVQLLQPNGTPGGNVTLAEPPPGRSRFVTWQNGATANCGVVPARNATWGTIKSLYR